jgi:uncharacterized protein
LALKALCVADLHGSEEALALLEKLVASESKSDGDNENKNESGNGKNESGKLDFVIVAGDITQFGPVDYAKRVVEIIRKSGAECVAVHGNTDSLQVKLFLEKEGVSIHNKKRILKGSDGTEIEFVGYGGSSPTPFQTAITYSEAQIYADLSKLVTKQSVLVTHSPPYGLPLELDKTFDLKNAGSKSVRKIVDERRPRACVCAHVHERSGETNVLGCRVIKLGPLKEGKYCVVNSTFANNAFH